MSQELSRYLDQRASENERSYRVNRGIARRYELAEFWKHVSQHFPDATLTTTTPSDGAYYASSVCWDFSSDGKEANEIQFYFSKNTSNPKILRTERINPRQNLVTAVPSVDVRVVSGDVKNFRLITPTESEEATNDKDFQAALKSDKDQFVNFLRACLANPHRTRDFSEDRLVRQFDGDDLVLRQRLEAILNSDFRLIDFGNATIDQVKFRVGREAARRFGISDLVDDIRDNEANSETVYASEKYGNRYVTSVRWGIDGSQSEGLRAQEVIVGITVGDTTANGLKEGSVKDKAITVDVVGKSKETFQVPVPFTDEPDINFLTRLANSKRKIFEAMTKASGQPHQSSRVSIGSVSSSVRVLDSMSRDRSFGSSRSINRSDVEARVRGLEDDSWDNYSPYDDEDMLSPGEAHGEITVDDGYATDEDGHSVYYE
ncbi:MAG TPA: hypothetical protein VG917_01440 [Patescibacteria group bacterium]|nr:hypothetical protein [Patescibacteria group bacterium]